MLLVRYPRQTLLYFLPAALVPLAAFVAAQYLEFGEFYLPYESFGSQEYRYEGSIWQTPLELDAFNKHPEPYWVYLFHMTFGHHGIFSLTPIFLFSAWGGVRLLGGGRLLTLWTGLTLLAIVGLGAITSTTRGLGARRAILAICLDPGLDPRLLGGLALFAAIPWLRGRDRPDGGAGLDDGRAHRGDRGLLHLDPQGAQLRRIGAGAALGDVADPVLAAAVAQGREGRPGPRLAPQAWHSSPWRSRRISVGYAMRNPWSHPWILDAMEHLYLYPLTR